jgi:hypothetical protein
VTPKDARPKEVAPRTEGSSTPDLDPRAMLELLEADQLVAAKQRTHFGRRQLSARTRLLLWGLRVYVVIMLVLVVISAFRVIHSGP